MGKKDLISKPLKDLLTQRIQGLYAQELQHQLHQVSFQFSKKTLIIVMEGTLTKPEQILLERDREQLAQKVRTVLNRVLLPQIRQFIEEVMDVTVVDFLCDTAIHTGRTGAIAILEFKTNSQTFGLTASQENS